MLGDLGLTVKCDLCNHMNSPFSVNCRQCFFVLAITVHDDSDSSDHAEASPSSSKLSSPSPSNLCSLLVQRMPAPCAAPTYPPYPAPDGHHWTWVDTGVAGMGWALFPDRKASASEAPSATPSAAPLAAPGLRRGLRVRTLLVAVGSTAWRSVCLGCFCRPRFPF